MKKRIKKKLEKTMTKRKWCYAQSPAVYQINCDLCGGHDITWSEFEHMIWCFKCEKDTPGNGGIFDGPIPVGVCKMMGIVFDRIDLETGKVIKFEDS